VDELKTIMKNIPIFALEGAAFAGKTTLINYLKKHYSDRVVVISEASEFVGGDKYFPDAPFKTFEEAKASTYYFVELEKRRCQDALRLYKETGLPVIMDRTTPISSLIFYSLLGHAEQEYAPFYEAVFQHALEVFQVQMINGNIFIPGGIIYIRPQDRDIFEMRLSRKTKNEVFSSWESFEYLDKKYKKLMEKNYKKEETLVLNSQNSAENLEQVARETVDFVESISPVCLPEIFEKFLGKERKFVLNVSINEEKQFEKITNHCRYLMDKAKNTL